jgi:multiple sugar transport system substrate-binding protein
MQSFSEFAKSIAMGHIIVSDLYSNTQVMTGEVAAGIGSSASILYYNDTITYPDNTKEPMNLKVVPLPQSSVGEKLVTQAGVGLVSYKTTTQKAEAAFVFAKWLTEKENNLRFVTSTGYLPVTDEAFTELFADTGVAENENYRNLYDMMNIMMNSYELYSLPVYDNASDIQSRFEQNVKLVLKSAHNQYVERTAKGEDKKAVLNELAASSLEELKKLSDKDI